MNLRLFEGPAGVGKTTRLIEAVAEVVREHPLREHQKVLALTKMHGSRRRLLSRLGTVPALRGRFECATVDSFAGGLLHRWKSLAEYRYGQIPGAGEFSESCRCAGGLLNEEVVHNWVAEAYPVVLIDEFQDCKDGQIQMLAGLSKSAVCLLAADEFQDLESDHESPAVAWARQRCAIDALEVSWRTKMQGLLKAAAAIRSGTAPQDGLGFSIFTAQNKNVGASFVSRNITFARAPRDLALLSPVRPSNSAFVREVIARVEEKPFEKNGKTYGPHRLPWEASHEEEEAEFISELELSDNPDLLLDANGLNLRRDRGGPAATLAEWLDFQRKVADKRQFTVAELRSEIARIHQRSRAFRRMRELPVRGMTIHQAKNREFDSVIILWPYEVTGSDEHQRRLLYNAVTRAKRQAIVIIQDPKGVRRAKPPFSAS